MPFAGFHGLDLIVILVIALLIFGPKKLPEMGSAIGKSIQSFKKGMSEITEPKEEKLSAFEEIERNIASERAAAATAGIRETPVEEVKEEVTNTESNVK